MQLFNISSSLGLLGTCLYGNSLCCCHPMYCEIAKVHITPIDTILVKSADCRDRAKELRVSFSHLYIRNIFPPYDKCSLFHEQEQPIHLHTLTGVAQRRGNVKEGENSLNLF